MISMSNIANEVSAKTMIPPDTVKLIIKETFETIWGYLKRHERVILQGIGTFRLYDGTNNKTGRRSVFPRFRIAATVRPSFNDVPPKPVQPKEENVMEKYGVKLNESKKLQAKLSGQCPDCKAELVTKNPPQCPQCGTKPFEEDPSNEPTSPEAA